MAGPSYLTIPSLIALIVDHSVAQDQHWPMMLSVLVQAGVVKYLRRIADLPLPPEQERPYRTIHNAKRDALIGVVRVFEQMQAKDIRYIGKDILDTLERLRADQSQPLTVQWQANEALKTWDT